MENNDNQQPVLLYTEEQLMARLKFFIGVCLAMTLTGIVFVVLYSLIFVTQPLNAMSPIDQKFFELIVPIATFLTGTLSGIMLAGGDKDAQKMALQAAIRPTSASPAPTTPSNLGTFGSNTNTTPFQPSSGFGLNTSAPATNPFGSTTTGFGSTQTAQVVTGFGGKPAPTQPPDPVI